MDGRKLYKEFKEEEEAEQGVNVLILDGIVLAILGYIYLSWYGLVLAAVICFLVLRFPKLLFASIFPMSFLWGFGMWKLLTWFNTTILHWEGKWAENVPLYLSIAFAIIQMNYRLNGYGRVKEIVSKMRGEPGGLLPDRHEEPANSAPASAREDYSEYRREGYIIRDYRAGRDRDSEG